MNRRKIYLLCFTFAVSCNSSIGVDGNEKKIKNDKGELSVLPYIVIKHDTLLNGKAVYYDTEGKIKEEVQYKYGLKEGWDNSYDSLHQPISRVFYRNNLRSGYSYFYDISRTETTKRYYIDGIEVLDLRMKSSIRPIQYRVLDNRGRTQYVVLFDSSGRKVYENGFVFQDSIYYVQPKSEDSIFVNLPVELKVFAPQLPDYSPSVQFYIFDKDGRKLDVKSNIVSDSIFTIIKFKPKTPGQNTIVIVGELRDADGGTVKRDTLIEKIKVNK